MALYLFRFGYTPEAWAALLEKPADRRDMLASQLFAFGGQLQGFWYASASRTATRSPSCRRTSPPPPCRSP